jgi:putative heme-binding domain-containing protein
LQKTEAAERWTIAGALAARAEFAEDPVLPRMVWYGVEGAVKDNPAKAARLAAGARMPAVSRSLARRLTQGLADRPEGADGLVAALAGTPGARKPALEGMVEALRGFRRTAAPEGWAAAREGFATDQDPAVGSLARRVAVVFGDPVALEELREVATDGNRPAAERREAIGTLVDARAEEAVPVLEGLLADEGLSAEAVRGLAAYGRPGTPGLLIGKFGELPAAGQGEAIAALASGPEGAALLLETIGSGAIPRERVPVFQVRQMLALGGEVGEKAAATWPEMRTVSGTAADRIAEWKARLTPSELSRADLSAGRGLFKQTCASCHVLFGEGAKIGPELTGSQRSSLDYLLENLADPSATVGADFRMSVVALADGRVLNGVVAGRTDQSLTLQTPTERLVIPMGEVEEVRQTTLSLMPEGQLDLLKPEQVRDLVGYLMSPTQVPEK